MFALNGKFYGIARFIVEKIIRPKWVVFAYNDVPFEEELGFCIFGVVVGLYKAETIYPTNPIGIRVPRKREFGESLHVVNK
jgi:hypothetical protein